MANNDITDPLLKDKYFDAYDAYLNQMTLHCEKIDNVIYEPLCLDFLDKNEFIKDSDFYSKLKMQRTKACLSNTNTTLNSICEKLNIVPIASTTYNVNLAQYIKNNKLNTLDITILASTDNGNINNYIHLPIVRPSINKKFDILNHTKLSLSSKGNLIITDTANSNIIKISSEIENEKIPDFHLFISENGNLFLIDSVDNNNKISVVNIPESERKNRPFYFGCDKSLNLFVLDSKGKYIWNSTSTPVTTLASINTDSNGITLITNTNENKVSSTTAVLNAQFYNFMGMCISHGYEEVNCNLPLKGRRSGSLYLLENGNLMTYDINNQIVWSSNTADLGVGPFKLIFSPNGFLKLIDSQNVILMSISFNNTITIGPYGLYVNELGIINIISLSGMLLDNKPCPPLWTSLDYGFLNVFPNIKNNISKTEISIINAENALPISVSNQAAATEDTAISDNKDEIFKTIATEDIPITDNEDKNATNADLSNIKITEKSFIEQNMNLLIILIVCVLVLSGFYMLKKNSNNNVIPSTI